MQLHELGHMDAVGIDILESPYTTRVGSITDRDFVRDCMQGVDVVFHTATLHKPHVATHTRQQFVDTNIAGTLALLEEAVLLPVAPIFIFTSTTSVYGDALEPVSPTDPAVWITENTVPVPKNIYGVTKVAAEDLCQLFHRNEGLACIVLRTSRFFPEEDDNEVTRDSFSDQNSKANEYLHRRVEIQDCVSAHLRAAERARDIGFSKYIISATTPFSSQEDELHSLRSDPSSVIRKYVPLFDEAYAAACWRMSHGISRVYDNTKARTELNWSPKYDFEYICKAILFQIHLGHDSSKELDITSPRAQQVGRKYYHRTSAQVDATSSGNESTAPYPMSTPST